MDHEHRLLSFAGEELPKTGEQAPERPQTIEERAAERVRRLTTGITPDNAGAVVVHAGLAGPQNETVNPEILRARDAMVESAKQDIAPMLTRLGAALTSAGRGSPEANAILAEIANRLNVSLDASGQPRASTRAENDARALANAINAMTIPTEGGGSSQRIRVQAVTERDGRWALSVGTE